MEDTPPIVPALAPAPVSKRELPRNEKSGQFAKKKRRPKKKKKGETVIAVSRLPSFSLLLILLSVACCSDLFITLGVFIVVLS